MSNVQGTIVLVPVGPVSPDLPAWLQDHLAEALSRPVATGEAIPLPAGGYNERRRQVRGEAILGALRTLSYPASSRVLGLAEADCYAPGLNYVFGQASLNERRAFVALPRLRPSFYGLADDPRLYRRRALIECVHELGHTWDLGHCPNPHCVMRFSNSLADTDAKGATFCSRCRGLLKQAGHFEA